MVTETINLITEKQFEAQVKKLALMLGFTYYHTHRSQFSPSGFPDCVMVKIDPEPRLIFAELKTDDVKKSQPSFEQWEWLYILQQLPEPVECYLWRPADFQEIADLLSRDRIEV